MIWYEDNNNGLEVKRFHNNCVYEALTPKQTRDVTLRVLPKDTWHKMESGDTDTDAEDEQSRITEKCRRCEANS